MLKKIFIQILSRQPFIFILGLPRRCIIRSSFFDIRVLTSTSKVKTEIGSKVFYPSTIEKYAFIGVNTIITPGSVIKRYASIGNNCVIGTGDHSIDASVLNTRFLSFGIGKKVLFDKTIIEEDVWVGNSVSIKGGCKLGRSSIVGMGSLVLSDLNRYAIGYGVPMREHRMRLEADIIDEIESTKWWNLDLNEAGKILGGLN